MLAVIPSPDEFDRMADGADRLRLQAAGDEAERGIAVGEIVSNDEVMAEIDG